MTLPEQLAEETLFQAQVAANLSLVKMKRHWQHLYSPGTVQRARVLFLSRKESPVTESTDAVVGTDLTVYPKTTIETQKTRLKELEKDLQQYLHAVVETGHGLKKVEENAEDYEKAAAILNEIRTSECWKTSGQTSFYAYLHHRWPTVAQFVRDRAVSRYRMSQMRQAAAVMERLQKAIEDSGVDLPLPTSESQARALSAVPEESRLGVWETAVVNAEEEGSTPVARHVEEARDKFLARQDPARRESIDKRLAFEQGVAKTAAKIGRSYSYFLNWTVDDVRKEIRIDTYRPADAARGFTEPRRVAKGTPLTFKKLDELGFFRKDAVHQAEGNVIAAVAELVRWHRTSGLAPYYAEKVAALTEVYDTLIETSRDAALPKLESSRNEEDEDDPFAL